MPEPTLMTRLREATRQAHDALESLPYSQSFEHGDLPLESYVGHLRAMAVLHAVVERQLSDATDARIDLVWTDSMVRFHRIQADLGFFASKTVLDIPAAADAAGTLANHVLRRSGKPGVSLLGYLYVLEGSVGGAQVLAPMIGQAFGLDEYRGLAYLSWDAEVAEGRWREFGERMNALLLDDAEKDSIVEAALEAFAGVQQLFSALYPFDSAELTPRVAALNPEAGAHQVPKDPAEVDAAVRAGARCWQEYPYFAWRYGERGWRFTLSDGAWLVTLAGQPQTSLDAQVRWLAGVLASRGMPSILLQRHLELIYEELQGRMPQSPDADYRTLLTAADRLAERRRAVISDTDFDAIVIAFEQAVGPDWRLRLPNTGSMLVSAVADRANGVAAAVSSLDSWCTDPQRFPNHWLEAVREALGEAEVRIRR